VFWPDKEECNHISQWIHDKGHFPKCVGFIDGTHLGLAFKLVVNGEECNNRKQQYAEAAMVICDDHKRITYLNIGWPGSVHDQRICQNCKLNKMPGHFFSLQEYLLGDSAFTNNAWTVPAYNKFGGLIVLAPGQFFSMTFLLLSTKWNIPSAYGRQGSPVSDSFGTIFLVSNL
jgi:hypothetical protein